MMKILLYIRLWSFGLLRYLPGKFGQDFENRWYWALRRVRTERTQESFERSLTELDSSSICIDLGANIGVFTERLASHAGHVHAFEPDPWSFQQLAGRVGHLSNVSLYNAAVGVSDGKLTLLRDPGFKMDPTVRSQGSSAFASLLWSTGEPERIEVDKIDFRRFLRDLGSPISLVKIDIEGAEVELLEALLEAPELNLIKEIYVETHEPQMAELRPRLKALRSRIRGVRSPIFHLDWH